MMSFQVDDEIEMASIKDNFQTVTISVAEYNGLKAQIEQLREVTPKMLQSAHFNEAGSILISNYVGGYSLITSLYQTMFDAATKGPK